MGMGLGIGIGIHGWKGRHGHVAHGWGGSCLVGDGCGGGVKRREF